MTRSRDIAGKHPLVKGPLSLAEGTARRWMRWSSVFVRKPVQLQGRLSTGRDLTEKADFTWEEDRHGR